VRRWGLLLLLLVCPGCSAVFHAEPALDFPAWPKTKFTLTEQGAFCLDQDDMQAFSKWLDKLRAFEAARQRLLKAK